MLLFCPNLVVLVVLLSNFLEKLHFDKHLKEVNINIEKSPKKLTFLYYISLKSSHSLRDRFLLFGIIFAHKDNCKVVTCPFGKIDSEKLERSI